MTILGRRWGSHERELRERLGISLQESRLTEKLTVFETLELFRSFYPRGATPSSSWRTCRSRRSATRASASSRAASGSAWRSPARSPGTRRSSFLDEPTTGLDPQSRLQLWERIAAYKAAGRTVLLTTHYMEEAERLCDRVAVVDHGKIIAQGSPEELIAGLHAPHIIEFSTEPAGLRRAAREDPGIGERRQRDGRWLLAAASLAQAVPALLSALDGAGASSCPSRRIAPPSRTSSSR